MFRLLPLAGARLAIVSLALCPQVLAAAQSSESYRVVSSSESTFQGEIDLAAADGYRLITGDASVEVTIWQRATDNVRRSYAFAPDIERFLKEGKLKAGFRLVPSTFAADELWFSAVFEKVEGDDQPRSYGLVKARSSGGLRKRFEEGVEGSAGVVAIASGQPGAAAIYERTADERRAAIIASGKSGTIKQEVQAAASRRQCIVDADGVEEAVYVVSACAAGGAARDYDVIATTKTDTFERELNAAAARGMRLVPQALLGIEKRLLVGAAYNNEVVGIIEKSADAAPVTYRVLGTVRVSTLEKELQNAANDGFTLIAFTLGPKEAVAVLEKR